MPNLTAGMAVRVTPVCQIRESGLAASWTAWLHAGCCPRHHRQSQFGRVLFVVYQRYVAAAHETAMPAFAATCSIALPCLQVHISHVGTASFKGIKEPQVVMQLSSGRLACRTFPWDLPSTKADLVQRGRGLSYVIRLCDPLQASRQLTRRRSNLYSYVPSPATGGSQDGQD